MYVLNLFPLIYIFLIFQYQNLHPLCSLLWIYKYVTCFKKTLYLHISSLDLFTNFLLAVELHSLISLSLSPSSLFAPCSFSFFGRFGLITIFEIHWPRNLPVFCVPEPFFMDNSSTPLPSYLFPGEKKNERKKKTKLNVSSVDCMIHGSKIQRESNIWLLKHHGLLFNC